MTRARRGQGGFTLIELMIAMVLFAVVIGVALQITLTISQGFQTTREAQGAERGARTSLEYLSDVVRASATGAPGSDLRDATYCTVAPALAVENHNDGPDKLTVVYGLPGTLTSLTSAFASSSSSFSVNDATGLTVGDNVIVTDGTVARLVHVSSLSAPSGNATLGTQAPQSACPNVAWPSSGFGAGSIVLRGRVARFYVANASDGTPMLWMDPDGDGPAAAEPLAEGIEDMQIALGFDNNRDGNIVEVGSAPNDDEWVFNVAGETRPATLANLKVVRITLVAKSTQLEPELVSQRPAAEDHPIGSNDGFFRRVIRTEITVRNFNL